MTLVLKKNFKDRTKGTQRHEHIKEFFILKENTGNSNFTEPVTAILKLPQTRQSYTKNKPDLENWLHR
jgi:hypothetical protein